MNKQTNTEKLLYMLKIFTYKAKWNLKLHPCFVFKKRWQTQIQIVGCRNGENLICFFYHSGFNKQYSEVDPYRMLDFLVNNIFVMFGGGVFQQIVGIPMGLSCAPLLADLFIYSYEADSFFWFDVPLYGWCSFTEYFSN